MNFERTGPDAFNEETFPEPVHKLASAHVGEEEVILIESEDPLELNDLGKISSHDENEAQPLRQPLVPKGHPDVSFMSAMSKELRSMKAKNAKREERPKGSADLPFEVN